MLHPGLIFAAAIAFLIVSPRLRLPLPLALIAAAALAALLAGFFTPWRHLVEGGFGYLNLIMALFAGAFFGQVMRLSGAPEAVADWAFTRVGGNRLAVGLFAGSLLFLVGMFVGIAGVAVLSAGVFAIPMLRRIGVPDARIGAFVAVVATCGMVAPPVNVPAMTIADGVNMPFADFSGPLLALSVPPAVFAIAYLVLGRAQPSARPMASGDTASRFGWVPLAAVLGFWALLRAFPTFIPDPGAPIVLAVGGLLSVPAVPRSRWRSLIPSTFGGVPLELAAMLVAIGVVVQIMALTGVRGWLVMQAISFPQPWTVVGLAGLPVLGSVLTSIGAANVLGVPFAFAYIHQDMIVNVSALSAVAALSEFAPPTAISAALATYLVGGPTFGQVLRHSLVPLLAFTLLAVAVLVFGRELAPYLVIRSA